MCVCAVVIHANFTFILCQLRVRTLWACIGRLLLSYPLSVAAIHTYATQCHNDIWQLHAFKLLFPISSSYFHPLSYYRVRPLQRALALVFLMCVFFLLPDIEKLPLTYILCKGLNCLPLNFLALSRPLSLFLLLSILSASFLLLTLLLTIQIKINVARTGDFLLCGIRG